MGDGSVLSRESLCVVSELCWLFDGDSLKGALGVKIVIAKVASLSDLSLVSGPETFSVLGRRCLPVVLGCTLLEVTCKTDFCKTIYFV